MRSQTCPGGHGSSALASLLTCPCCLPPLLACCSDAGKYEGEAQNLVWRQDPSFGEVLDCDEVGG